MNFVPTSLKGTKHSLLLVPTPIEAHPIANRSGCDELTVPLALL